MRSSAQLATAISRNAALFGSFNGEFSDRSQTYAGKGGLKVGW
jgi:uncharacterized protein with beta-barrel porin domain